MEVAVDTLLTDLTCACCGSHFSLVDQSQATQTAPPLSQLGRFELIERLGVGGFGSVWKARDKDLDRTVAIKIPRAGAMSGEEQEKFFREARAVAQLKHSNIVSVHEVGRDGDSVYIVSDFVRGVTLGDWLTGQQLTSREASELCAKIADALHHAHQQGVVHRDLKPANIMMDYDGQPHLTDFGLARRESGEITMTFDGQVIGTPAYMSPEQAAGEAHTADRRSDVYSLGVIFFQLLTGELPFRGNAQMLIKQVIHDEPPSLRKLNSSIAKDLETIALKCLEKEPSQRFESAQEFATDLRRYLAGQSIKSRPVGRATRVIRWIRRNKTVSALMCAVIIALSIGLACSSYFAVVARSEARKAQSETARAEHVQYFLTYIFKMADPWSGSWRSSGSHRDTTIRQALDESNRIIDTWFFQDQVALGEIELVVGEIYLNLNELKKAEEHLERAYRISRQYRDTTRTAKCAGLLGRLSLQQHRYSDARELLRDSYQLAMQNSNIDNETLGRSASDYAVVLANVNETDLAESVLRQGIAKLKSRGRLGNIGAAYMYTSLGGVIQLNRKQYADAVFSLNIALSITRHTYSMIYPHTRYLLQYLCEAYIAQHDYENAKQIATESVLLSEQVFGKSDVEVLSPLVTLRRVLVLNGNYNEARDVNGRLQILATAISSSSGAMDAEAKSHAAKSFNAVAWSLATSSINEVRDGERSVKFATTACELSQNSPGYLDTLAAAYAESGDFDAAIRFSERSIDLLRHDADSSVANQLKDHLRSFRAKKRVRSLEIEE